MTTIHHFNAGWLQVPPGPKACCHCLLLQDAAGFALVDTGIGLADVRDPVNRIGQVAIDAAGFQFNESDTLIRQLEARNILPAQIHHIILTHLDPDHAGGLSDFPGAAVHLAAEELIAAQQGDPRYRPMQLGFDPSWIQHAQSTDSWYGLEARRIDIGFQSTLYLVPLFGHTAGHCGVAIGQPGNWVLHAGDAYYLRAQLADPNHPVEHLAALRAVDNEKRLHALEHLRRLHRDHSGEIRIFGYHDPGELSSI